MAQEPFDLPGELVDQAEVLGDTSELVADQDAFAGRTGLQLFVVVVDDFEGSSASGWLERTAGLSGLGEQDLAVAVSVDDADAAVRVPEGSRLRPGEVGSVVDQVVAQARARDPQGAVDTAVTGLTALDPVDPAQRARAIAAWTVGILLALAVLLAGALWWRRRRARARPLADAGRRAEELSAQLGADVVALDQELEDTRLRVELAGADADAAATAQARSELAAGELEALDVHRARADLSIGPTDDPTWRRPVTEVVTELERLRGLAASARGHLADARDALPR
ncbi:hypothetical protein SGUI_1340 [Serinicoccus hydrothermalis]|uniref:TPM domain-containing protein n=1 Tax=Serinicoccus hydrothermalis TaxID=1758689 RepID=A0A1B1NBC9_9MICO|nr:hypothetical protein SGUI_1340 [Serinicoccus hydrothermalis]